MTAIKHEKIRVLPRALKGGERVTESKCGVAEGQ